MPIERDYAPITCPNCGTEHMISPDNTDPYAEYCSEKCARFDKDIEEVDHD
jgi:endogenous inhibitor of DNA gyrase (YacG/DUF329 family)